MADGLPQDWHSLIGGDRTLYGRAPWPDLLHAAGFDADDHPQSSESAQIVRMPGGRGETCLIKFKKSDAPPLVWRHYRHGGLLGDVLSDGYPNASRAINEAAVSLDALQRGAPVAEPVAIRVCGRGPCRLDIFTLYIENATDCGSLLMELQKNPDALSGAELRRLVTLTAQAVKRLADAGVAHPDLNLTNILAHPAVENACCPASERYSSVTIVDLDKARILKRIMPGGRVRMMARLARSYDKMSGGAPLLPGRDQLRFLKVCLGPDAPKETVRGAIREISAAIKAHRFWRTASRRG
ncbi:MAG TPA: lipopolysaccharide kinase InaA family protein [Candidatus Brocadiia bacterium]|nr:lipopolysaccharide kinase InaA family protein [Candidatus Brocadiia bacterium]